jgi:hypothetical protein
MSQAILPASESELQRLRTGFSDSKPLRAIDLNALRPDTRTKGPCPRNTSSERAEKRLRVIKPSLLLQPARDFVFGALGPMLFASAAAALLLWVIENNPRVKSWGQTNLRNDNAMTALGSMLTFFVVSRASANLAQNAAVVGLFGSLCGATLGLAMQLRGLTANGDMRRTKSADNLTFNCGPALGVLVRSIPYLVLLTLAQGASAHLKIVTDGVLPLLDNINVSNNVKRLVQQGMSPSNAVLYYVTCIVADLDDAGKLKTPEVGVVMKHAFDIARLEGDIAGAITFQPAVVVDLLVYGLLLVYFVLLLFGELVPDAKYASIWVSAIIACSTAGVYGISRRLKNPCASSAKNGRQAVSMHRMAQETEIQIYVMLVGERPM